MPLATFAVRSGLILAASVFLSVACNAQDAPDSKLFTDSIAPLLQKHCVSCHGAEMQEGGLRLDSLTGLSKGGKSGAILLPGKPDQSLLITAVRRTDELLQMPPDEKLPDQDVKLLIEWVQTGAVHPDGAIVVNEEALHFDLKEARQFWSFQPVQMPVVPDVENKALVYSPIDAFVVCRLAESGLQPNPVADKATLIRRATFDLTGLPPTPLEIQDFIADESPNAFVKVLDRLLASQQYGERWGRHWLDVVRYADSNGLDENIAHGNAWRYRNYVINSLNADKPYDLFLREQLAGDLLIDEQTDEATRHDRLIATGFLSMGPKVLAEGDETKLQMDILDEQIDTIGRSMLGLTLGCARCHDHKFDPIAQADYYAIAGIFQSTKTMESLKRIAKWNENSIATAADKANLEAHQAKIEARKKEIADYLEKAKSAAAVSAGTGTSQQVAEEQLPEEARKELATLRDGLKQLESTIPELPTAMGVAEGTVTNSKILLRGNHLSPGRAVDRGVPVVLASEKFVAPAEKSGRREFAEWLTSPTHPLTARVIVNRVWRWHFGRGLVATADNFGKLGDRPGNQALLDWLANDLVQSGWSLKALHKKIMLSRTWQLSHEFNEAAAQKDPDNFLQWRWSTQRLEAEAVRDSLLAVSGLLDKSMGQSMLHVKNREFLFDHTSKDGTSYDSKRRSVYLPVIRNNLYDAMSLFDCTDGTVPNGDRASSTVASQALFLMNSDLVIQAAEQLAGELLKEFPEDPRQRADVLVMRTLGRPAKPTEIDQILASAETMTRQLQTDGVDSATHPLASWTAAAQVMLMSNEFLYVR